MTYTQAKKELRELGFTLTKVDGDLRLYPVGRGDLDYWPSDVEDAVNTALGWDDVAA